MDYRIEISSAELIVEVKRLLTTGRRADRLICRYLADMADRIQYRTDPALDLFADEYDAAQCAFGLSVREARERIRIGRALRRLPRIEHAFISGDLCYSRVREITRVAQSANESQWLDLARNIDMRDLERRVAHVSREATRAPRPATIIALPTATIAGQRDVDGRAVNGSDIYGGDVDGRAVNGSDIYGGDVYGGDVYGGDIYGRDANGSDVNGGDIYGSDIYGSDIYGSDAYSSDIYGRDANGSDVYGRDANGSDVDGRDVYGFDVDGRDVDGRDVVGRDVNGSDANGSDVDGRDVDGRDVDGRDVDGRDVDGQDVDGRDVDGRDVVGRDVDGRDVVGRDVDGRDVVGRDVVGAVAFTLPAGPDGGNRLNPSERITPHRSTEDAPHERSRTAQVSTSAGNHGPEAMTDRPSVIGKTGADGRGAERSDTGVGDGHGCKADVRGADGRDERGEVTDEGGAGASDPGWRASGGSSVGGFGGGISQPAVERWEEAVDMTPHTERRLADPWAVSEPAMSRPTMTREWPRDEESRDAEESRARIEQTGCDKVRVTFELTVEAWALLEYALDKARQRASARLTDSEAIEAIAHAALALAAAEPTHSPTSAAVTEPERAAITQRDPPPPHSTGREHAAIAKRGPTSPDSSELAGTQHEPQGSPLSPRSFPPTKGGGERVNQDEAQGSPLSPRSFPPTKGGGERVNQDEAQGSPLSPRSFRPTAGGRERVNDSELEWPLVEESALPPAASGVTECAPLTTEAAGAPTCRETLREVRDDGRGDAGACGKACVPHLADGEPQTASGTDTAGSTRQTAPAPAKSGCMKEFAIDNPAIAPAMAEGAHDPTWVCDR